MNCEINRWKSRPNTLAHVHLCGSKFYDFARLFWSFFFFLRAFLTAPLKVPRHLCGNQMNKWTNDKPTYHAFQSEKNNNSRKKREKAVCAFFSCLLWIGYKVNIINRVAFRWFVPHWISNQVKSTLVCTIMMASSVRNLYCAVGWKQKRIRNNNQSSIKWHWNHSRANTPLDAPLPWRKMYPTNVSISIWIVDSIH